MLITVCVGSPSIINGVLQLIVRLYDDGRPADSACATLVTPAPVSTVTAERDTLPDGVTVNVVISTGPSDAGTVHTAQV